MLKLYNTLSKNIEEIPQKDHLNLYTCGPTVYNYAHIGNLRSYIMADLLYRTLKFDGYKPRWVMNITDIDDKTIKGTVAKYGAAATVENLREFTKFYLDEFLKDLGEVNVLKDEITFIRVTDVIPQTQDFIVELINKGYAYKADDGSTYFSIDKYQKDFGDYGQLVGEKFIEGKKVGARVAVDEYEKDNLSDFALWKAWDEKTDAQIFWDHPVLGKGRPGWHIECSVINKIGFNGEPTDIHTGGVDLIFPHHTNEIAQSQALIGKGNFVHHWFHSEHLLVDGKKMAKSTGNFYTLKDLQDQKKDLEVGIDLRHYFLNIHYRGQQNFVYDKGLESVEIFLRRTSEVIFKEANEEIRKGLKESILKVFKYFLDEDLGFPQGQREVFHVLQSLGKKSLLEFQQALYAFKEVLGLEFFEPQIMKVPVIKNGQTISVLFEKFHQGPNFLIPEGVVSLLFDRYLSKNDKDFKKSDEIRKQIEDLGYEVMDTPEGQKVKKKLQI